MNRRDYAEQIYARLCREREALRNSFIQENRISTFVLDDVLDQDTAREVYAAFPVCEKMVLKKTFRERKYIAAQMDLYNPLLEEIIYAFQDERIVEILSEITGIDKLIPDENLYAGGISLMAKDNFLNPHVDNSHDGSRRNYRLLNLLYYVTPDWPENGGGNLELWDKGVQGEPRTIWSRFNRLVVMLTDQESYHSVSPVIADGQRCCVSNYYFSPVSFKGEEYFHVTSFRGRPGQVLTDMVSRSDAVLRGWVRRLFRKGVVENRHVYRKSGGENR